MRLRFTPNKVFGIWVKLDNELERFLLFDTASQHIALRQETIDQLELIPTVKFTRPLSADSATAGQIRPIYLVHTLEAFGAIAHNVEVTSVILPSNCGFDGLLGVAFLKHFVFTIDYGEGLIEINPRA